MKCKKCGSDWNSASGKVLTKCPFCDADLAEKENTNDSEAVRAIKDILKKYGVSVMSEKARFIGLFGDYAPKLAHEKRILQLALDENTAKYFVNCKEAEHENNLAKAQNNLLEVLNENTVKEILEIFVGVFEWKVKMPQTAQKPVPPTPKHTPPAPKPIPPTSKPAPPAPKPIPPTSKPAPPAPKPIPPTSKPVPPAPKPIPPASKPVPPAYKPNKKNKTITIKDVTFGKGMYVGQINSNRQPHGHGKAVYYNGNVYDGEWKNNNRNGKGKMTYANGNIYLGEWKNGLPEGFGIMTYRNGVVYEGRWEAGIFKG